MNAFFYLAMFAMHVVTACLEIKKYLGQKCSEILLTAFVIYVWKSQLFDTTRQNISFIILQESKNTAQMCWDAIVAFNNEWQVGTRLKILIFGECNFST